ncbi:hypothetical protein BDP27DRAFT_1398485 [Rhodocollybia butyracea]|uniref:Phospholipase n=1 Tax=Rhodocollybia butyracea TaxID=206335 RepID=A0A9P5Q0W1_9AGAR|nr:hypothetical protein BDP27DRAFT_1398485 [Rhodocollybia butyracea]
MSLFDKVLHKAEEGLKRAEDQVAGFLNPDHRHDSAAEKAEDQVRAEINASHRFDSFAQERTNNVVKWHVDGHDYMWAVSEMLDNAKQCIFILDWWLTPELYLRRPPAKHPEWRLDKVLKRKAEQGVKIYVVVYKEVTATMSMGSKHTKAALEHLNPPGTHQIQCMRHPDHIGAKDTVEFWSHHEKVVVVDNHYACIGGLDLCFGRWDTHSHPLSDVHPTHWYKTLFPGQDYNNARIMDFQTVDNYASNQLNILESARMPWHDNHMTLSGPVVLDIVQHFVERWNEIKKRKYRQDSAFDWLAFPHNVQSAPNEPIARHPHREAFHKMGRAYKQRWHDWMGQSPEEEPDDSEEGTYYRAPMPATMKVQVVRSVCDWSHGVLTEHSVQNAYIQLINESRHYIYIENQFFISATHKGDVVTNQIAGALAQRIIRAARDGQNFKVVVVIPEVPAFSGNIKDESSLKTIMAAQYRTINRGGHSIYEVVRKAGYEPMEYIRFYHLRAYDRINAPQPSYLERIQEQSGTSFHQAQVALARQWLGDSGPAKVTIKSPEVSKEGVVITEKTPVKEEAIDVPATEEEAREIIAKYERAAEAVRGDEKVADNVVQHMLEDKTDLLQEKWLGSEQEELDAYVSELVYIHSKVMIVDDKRVIMGSANLNDRSQKGDGDSEIALVVEDTDLVPSMMDGKPYMAARFATSLRRQLYKEHLGLIPPQDADMDDDHPTAYMRPAPYPNPDRLESSEDQMVADPLSKQTVDLWTDTARKNRDIFTEVFRPIPTNLVRDWNAYDRYVPKNKTGHVVPEIPLSRVKDRLSKVKGALVEAPIDFLIDDKGFVEGIDWVGLNPTLPIYL